MKMVNSVFPFVAIAFMLISGCKVGGRVVSDGIPVKDIPVIVKGKTSQCLLTDDEGKYQADLSSPGTYTVRPYLAGYRFEPETRAITAKSRDIDHIDFQITRIDLPEPMPPGQKGPYTVGRYQVKYTVEPYGTYTAIIRYPALCDCVDAKADLRGPFPAIIVANGYLASEWQITWVPIHLTSHGYITLSFTTPDPTLFDMTQWAQGFHGAIAKVEEESKRSESPIFGLLEESNFGAFGHSMGGAGCIIAAGNKELNIRAAVPSAPYGYDSQAEEETPSMRYAKQVAVPIQIIAGNKDTIVPASKVRPFYESLIPDDTVKSYVEIFGGNHISGIDNLYAEIASALGIESRDHIEFGEYRRIIGRYITAWFQYHLKDMEEYHGFIFGDGAQGDYDSGVLSDWEVNIP